MADNRVKILLTYKDETEYKVERVWATKLGNYYRIDNIPFFAKNVALGDVVSVEEDESKDLFFDRLIESSGNSVIQMIIFDERSVGEVGKHLESLGCGWEGSHIANYISVNVPKDVSYSKVKSFLDEGEKQGKWEYREACLGWK